MSFFFPSTLRYFLQTVKYPINATHTTKPLVYKKKKKKREDEVINGNLQIYVKKYI